MDYRTEEDVTNLQIDVVKMRRKYIPTIIKHEEQNKKIQLKILEKKEYKCKEMVEFPNVVLKENLLDFENTPRINPTEINAMKIKLRNLEKIMRHINNAKKCDIYKELQFKENIFN